MPCHLEFQRRLYSILTFALVLAATSLLAGCGHENTATAPSAFTVGSVQGAVHGGQQPVTGARIYVMQAAISGYGASAVDIVAPAVAITRGGGRDAIGPYFVSDANGYFNLSNGYTCTANAQVYVLVLGGNPGLGAGKSNPALGLAAVLGACPVFQTFQYGVPSIQINELTTVAAIYSLAGFMTSPSQVSTGTSSNAKAGLANAFLNASQLVNTTTGAVRDTTPNGRGSVPAAKIRTLADIIAPCINSDGTGSGCQTLFSATANGNSAPSNVVSALLGVAHAPFQNVDLLYSLLSSSAPFQPVLTTVPVDLTLSVAFSSGNFSAGLPAIDGSGSVWLPNTGSEALTVLDSMGNQATSVSPLGGDFGGSTIYITPPAVAIDASGFGWLNSTTSGIIEAESPVHGSRVSDGGGMLHSDATFGVALDASGNAFVTDTTSRLVAVFDNNGDPLSGSTGFANGTAWAGIAVDAAGRFFVADPLGNRIVGYNLSGTPATFTGGLSATLTGGGLSQPNSLAFDSANNVWIANGNNSLSKFQATTGTTLSSVAYTGGGLSFDSASQPQVSLAVDGAGTVWVANYAGQSISHFSAAGVALSPDGSGLPVSGCAARGLAVAPSGDVWVTCDSSKQPIVEFIGLATPVRTPLTVGAVGILP